jgi:hypothetical protein
MSSNPKNTTSTVPSTSSSVIASHPSANDSRSLVSSTGLNKLPLRRPSVMSVDATENFLKVLQPMKEILSRTTVKPSSNNTRDINTNDSHFSSLTRGRCSIIEAMRTSGSSILTCVKFKFIDRPNDLIKYQTNLPLFINDLNLLNLTPTRKCDENCERN